MSYCVQADLVNAFGELEIIQRTDRDNLGVIDTDVLNGAIARADADINRYLRKKNMDVNGVIVSEDLKYLACDMTRFYLFDTNVPDEVKAAFDRALATLADYVSGKIVLDIALPEPDTTQSAGDAEISVGDPLFGADQLAGY